MQLAMGQKFLFGTSNTIKYMKKMWEARSAGRNKRKQNKDQFKEH